MQDLRHSRCLLGTRDAHAQVLGTRGVCCDEGQVDICLGGGTQLTLGLLSCFPQPLNGQLVLAQVNALQDPMPSYQQVQIRRCVPDVACTRSLAH